MTVVVDEPQMFAQYLDGDGRLTVEGMNLLSSYFLKFAEQSAAIDASGGGIATNAAGIATNAAGIATNVAGIATNVADIAAIDERVTDL